MPPERRLSLSIRAGSLFSRSIFFLKLRGLIAYSFMIKRTNSSRPWPVLLLFCFLGLAGNGQRPIRAGAERFGVYVPSLAGKAVGIFANQSSRVGSANLVDTLLRLGVFIKKIFAPEHGFRGTADAGASIANQKDPETGIPIISLYGKKLKPSLEDLQDIDILVFDIQDVGVRFYTYVSSLQEFMEAAFECGKPLLLLDRPNPNGFYVDGPVLDTAYRSFVGMQPVPVVYGMTLGEYARMIAGEGWLSPQANARYAYYQHAQNSPDTPFHFLVIKCSHYNHDSLYRLPIKPSPNLPDMASIYLYPSLCFFEGTSISLGRGTDKPFQVFGHPDFPTATYEFTPVSREGASDPPWMGKTCFGFDLGEMDLPALLDRKLQLKWLLDAYRLLPDKSQFFLNRGTFFDRLAGGKLLRQQLEEGLSEDQIRKSWQPALNHFKAIRKKYLLYADFS
jgi:uncharacterized protein YbbC (DUF1343 family)